MSVKLSGSGGLEPVINVTPLIDVLLVLIIIFMMIQPQENGLNAEVPQPAPDLQTKTPETTVILEISSAGNGKTLMRINTSEVSKADLETKLRDIYKSRAEKIMFVKGDTKLYFSQVAEVIDIARAADRDIRVGLITRDLKSEE